MAVLAQDDIDESIPEKVIYIDTDHVNDMEHYYSKNGIISGNMVRINSGSNALSANIGSCYFFWLGCKSN